MRPITGMLVLAALLAACTTQNETNRQENDTSAVNTATETVSRLFIRTDARDWEGVRECFADSVFVDYSSMSGAPPADLTPEEIIDGWKEILPGFEQTQHQVGNFLVTVEDGRADVFCYGTALHFLPDERGDVYAVFGDYNFQLVHSDGSWKIERMTFNFKYQTGNTSLAELARERAKEM